MTLFFDFTKISAPKPFGNLQNAIDELRRLYSELDQQTQAVKERYPIIPCHCGCQSCCHEAVFMTPLEFWAIIDHIQNEKQWTLLNEAIKSARLIYNNQRELIDSFNNPPPDGEKDHFSLAKDLHYACPFLQNGCCQIYQARSLVARLFGSSFERPGIVYGCQLMEEALASLEETNIRLPSCDFWTKKLAALPFTEGRQVLPYYLLKVYGTT